MMKRAQSQAHESRQRAGGISVGTKQGRSASSAPTGAVIALFACVLGGALGCGSDFAERSEITGLRFLAVRASPPWIVPGQTSVIEPLVVGLEEGRTLSYTWTWCPLRGPNSAQFECLVTAEQVNDAIDMPGFEIDETFFLLGTEPTASFPYAFPPEIVGSICAAIRDQDAISNLVTLPDCDGTFPISVRVDVTDGERTITAFKNLRLVYDTSSNRPLNANPDISMNGLRLLDENGEVGGNLAFERPYLVVLGPDQGDPNPLRQLDRLSETYTATRTEANEDNEIVEIPFETREQLVFSWFASTGAWDDDRTGFLPDTVGPGEPQLTRAWADARSNEWETPKPADFAAGGTTRLWLVVRDERGGTSWTFADVTLGAPQ